MVVILPWGGSSAGGNDPNILYPIYAKDASGRSHTNTNTGVIGTAVKFDLTEKLRRTGGDKDGVSGIVMEVKKSVEIPETMDVKLWYAFDIEEVNRHNKTTPLGIWLPKNSSASIPGEFNAKTLDASGDTRRSASNLIYEIDAAATKDKKTMEFIFEINGLFVCRVDSTWTPGTALFDKLRTGGFNLDDIRAQQGGVTILRNVINPLKGESAALNYRITRGGRVTIQVFTLDGTLVRQLEQRPRSLGDYTVTWDGKNNGGKYVARGMYFIRIVAPKIDEIRKVMVVK
jgi:hypothetical protein